MAWAGWNTLIQKKSYGGMGFKDLRLFNQALLARQAWRLMEYPDSLCARLLKARYYPKGCLVDTSFCSNASSTWQSILHGLELLKQCVIWRIGDGRKVRIWRDPWIPRELSLRVTTTKGRQRSKWVAELLDANGRQWDFNKLIAMFNPADADAIARIKIPTRASEDVLAWHFDRTGTFTVRSAYNLAMQLKHKQGEEASSSSPNGERNIWSNIWKTRVPAKVKIFAWKLGAV